eukprot:1681195-Amphidinium_carterae.1
MDGAPLRSRKWGQRGGEAPAAVGEGQQGDGRCRGSRAVVINQISYYWHLCFRKNMRMCTSHTHTHTHTATLQFRSVKPKRKPNAHSRYFVVSEFTCHGVRCGALQGIRI